MLLDAEKSFLLIIDVQEKLAPAIRNGEKITSNICRLIDAAKQLNIPVLVTEHCADRIGRSVPVILNRVSNSSVLNKVHFSAVAEPECQEAFAALNRPQAIMCGTETHVCVLQTTLELCETGYQPVVVSDAVGSRHKSDRKAALSRVRETKKMNHCLTTPLPQHLN